IHSKENKIDMTNFILIIQNELRHFARSSFKIVSPILLIVPAAYGLQNGYGLFQKHPAELTAIKTKNDETAHQIEERLEKGDTTVRPWIDLNTPFWAISNAPATAIKTPSPLMPFTIGQAEQFGYYKPVTNWSSTFDSDLAEEIANPERLATGTLDF